MGYVLLFILFYFINDNIIGLNKNSHILNNIKFIKNMNKKYFYFILINIYLIII